MALNPNELGYIENDTLPPLRGTLTEDDGTPVNLTGCTVNLHINYNPVLIKTASIVNAIDGIWLVEWETGDLKAGRWFFEIQVTDSNGDIRTWRKEPSTDKYLTMVIEREIA